MIESAPVPVQRDRVDAQRRTAMKLARYGRLGAEKPGLIDAAGALRDLSRVVKDLTPAVLAPAALRKLRAVKTARLPIVRGKPRLGCPLAGIGKMVCIGLNYLSLIHISEPTRL